MKKLVMIIIAAVILTAATNVSAVPVTGAVPEMTGGPYISNSWYYSAGASGVGPYDLIAVRIASGADVFESPAIRNISNPSWSLVLDGPTLASFAGSSVTLLNWDVYFAGDLPMSTGLQLDWALFNGEQLQAWTHWNVNSEGQLESWVFKPVGGWQPARADVIPEPATITLLGLGSLALIRKRK